MLPTAAGPHVVAGRGKRNRRVKQTADGKGAPSKKAQPQAMEADGPIKADSPTAARVIKQQKITQGEAAVVRRCLALHSDENWNVSPPLGRVQERHIAFALHAKATRARGPSALQQTDLQSLHAPGSEARTLERLISGISSCELQL